jgi:hypothetical protein
MIRYHHAVNELIGIIMNCMYWYARPGLYDFLVQCMGWMISSCTACSENYHRALRVMYGIVMQCMCWGIVSWCHACDDQVSLCTVCKASDEWYCHALHVMIGIIIHWEGWQVSSCIECEVEYGCCYALRLMKWYNHTIHLMNGIIMR